jgi:pilus assembly protein CpaD
MMMNLENSTTGSHAKRLGRVARVAFFAAVAVTAAGCRPDQDPTRVASWSMIDPAQRHAIGVSREPELLNVKVARGSRGLSPSQRAEVVEFAARARAADAGNTKLVVAAPAGSHNEVESAHAVDEIRHLLSEGGIPATSVGLEAYKAHGDRAPPVRLAYFRYVAHAPECGHWPTNLARESQNVPYANFGCATQRNFANQVANPADLVEPRTETDRSSERRDTTWGKYVKGQPTGAERGPDEKGSADISDN